MEALVSFVILAVVATASVVATVNATKTSKNSTDRVTAANLAQRDLQAARSLRFPNYPAAVSQSVTVGTTTYAVARTFGSAGVCPATPNFTTRPYMIVTSTVTWPPAGRVVVSTEIAC